MSARGSTNVARQGPLGAWVSVAVINYNGRKVLGPTLDALRPLAAQRVRCIMVDDGSSDGSDHWVQQHYPEVRVVQLVRHFGKPSVARNRALHELTTPYVMLLDHDVVLQPGCLETLLDVITSQEHIFCCTARLLDSARPQHIYMDDGGLHFLCLSSRPHRGVAVAQKPAGAPLSSVGGGNLLIDREQALARGGFDTGYQFGWGEDAELPQRARIMGWQSLHVPAATALHMDRPHGRSRAEAQFYNRWRMILTQYHARTLLLLAPMLLLMELMLLAAAIKMKVTHRQWRAWRQIWRDRRSIMRQRHHLQLRRVAGDGQMLEAMPLAMTGAVGKTGGKTRVISCLNGACRGYWALVQPLLWCPRRRWDQSRHRTIQPLMPAMIGACVAATMLGGVAWMMPPRTVPIEMVVPVEPMLPLAENEPRTILMGDPDQPEWTGSDDVDSED